MATVSGVTAVFAIVGLGITLGTAPTTPGSTPSTTDPASAISPPTGPSAARPAAVPGPGASQVFEHTKNSTLATISGRIGSPERLWTGLVPAPPGGGSPGERSEAPDGSYAASAPSKAARKGREAGLGGHEAGWGDAYGRGRSPGETGGNRPIAPPAPDRREGPPAGMETPPDRPEPPATTPEPRPRRSPPQPQPPQPPRPSESPRRTEAERPRQVPNPCATFTDFRRDYCDRLLSGHTGTK
ncbi:hypothetical protein AB0O34_03965 [Sphaerisporangium sp. NPDC088356]|uniref:hypothetical protein n=1 Tax=Sphaerisporangium sp. NPDC088356 TaxID=3154871 RepID=UPI00343D43B0